MTVDAHRVDPGRELVPQPQWCSWLDDGPPPTVPEHRDAFAVRVRDDVAAIDAGGPPGRHYAECLVDQLRLLHPDRVPDLDVVDWPDLDHRGVMLDCSRNRVPTIETLESMFAILAGLRVNHVELYLETTFQHPGHADVWQDRDAYSPSDVQQLREAAAAHHIELVGQQNSLGHLEGWLACPRYAELAALPGGYTTPDATAHEPPACLEPTDPRSWDLVAELVSNLATAFDPPRVHVGLDEPIDLNPAVWDAIFDVPGARVPWADVDNGAFCVPLPAERLTHYVDWVHRLRALPALEGREMMMWADVVAAHPEILDKLPQGVTLVEWGYEGRHAFEPRCARIAAAARPFWVAPGTSGWSAIGGRIPNMVTNVDAAAQAAAHYGGQGMLMTSWGANPSVQDWPGFVWASASAWNGRRRPDLAAALDLAVVGASGAGLGSVWEALGTADQAITPTIPETTTTSELFRSGGMAGIGLALAGMAADQLDAVDRQLDTIARELDAAAIRATGRRADHAEIALLIDELAWVRDALAWGSEAARHRLGWPGAPDATCLRDHHRGLRDRHERLWNRRNRHGGYDAVAAELAATLGGI